MFIFNFKLNTKNILKTIITIAIIIVISLFLLAAFNTFHDLFLPKNQVIDYINPNDYAEIEPDNYSNILKEVHEDLDTYIGQKISFSGYVYRVSDLKDNQFILARDMKINNKLQTVVIGFLCECDNAKQFTDSTWVLVKGEIIKGYYYSDIPCVKVSEITPISEPESPVVKAPDETYIPTSIIY